jgi:DNA (cytosine-5)-methyltransferase 1
MDLTHFSLFTGIGGLDLAAEWAGFETVGQCEYADYPTKVLEKHWPNVPRWKDVRDLSGKAIRERGIGEITVLSGGFPCQPHSTAGKRKASADERDLWPEYRRLIGEIRPKWVVAENVQGLLSSEDGRFFRGILRDFSKLGFNVGWCMYPACWVGAVHRRERVFTIAYSDSVGRYTVDEGKSSKCCKAITQIIDCSKAWAWPDAKCNDIFRNGSRIINSGIGANKRNDDGIASGLYRLRCIGNMVMPQQAYPIFKAIAEIERGIA